VILSSCKYAALSGAAIHRHGMARAASEAGDHIWRDVDVSGAKIVSSASAEPNHLFVNFQTRHRTLSQPSFWRYFKHRKHDLDLRMVEAFSFSFYSAILKQIAWSSADFQFQQALISDGISSRQHRARTGRGTIS